MRAQLLRAVGTVSSHSRIGLLPQTELVAQQHLVLLRGSATAAGSETAEAVRTTSSDGSKSNSRKRFVLYPAVAAAALTSAAAATVHHQTSFHEDTSGSSLLEAAWVQEIPQRQDVLQVLSAQSIGTHPLLKQDHIFTAFIHNGQLKDMICFYDTAERKYYNIMQLGRVVCGFPTIVHGGFTATIMDETLGFLFFALKKQNALPFWGPAYTAHLEVDYKAKISAGATILCTAEVESMEGRKVWMRSTITEGPTGKVYATARALFVAPSSTRLAKDAYKLMKEGVFPPDRLGTSM